MAEESFSIQQNIFRTTHPAIRIDVYRENLLNKGVLDAFLDTIVGGAVGVAPTYGAKCVLKTLAFSSASHILLVHFSPPQSGQKKSGVSLGRDLLRDFILCHPTRSKYAFKMDKLAAALHHDFGIRIDNAIDLLSMARADRQSLEALMFVLGGETNLNKPQVCDIYKEEERASPSIRTTAIQSWAAYTASKLEQISTRLIEAPRINTRKLAKEQLDVICKTIRDYERLVALKPTRVKNEVESKFSHKKGNMEVVSSRFKTRVMRTAGNQIIEIETFNKGKQTKVVGRTARISGRTATISIQGSFQGNDIRAVTTIGREAPTTAEALRSNVMLKTLQGISDIMDQPFVQRIFLPKSKLSWGKTPVSSLPTSLYFPSTRKLNVSQAKAVNVILSNNDADRISLIHGPPGTGKTTVIAAAVTSVMASADRDRTMWLVAQSNVAVKNIAEKLASIDFFDFKLLVSKDFHFDWHEHLYERIEANVIRSDDFNDSTVGTERQLLGSRVILCTLSMLSHNKLATFIRLVPPQTLIFDEASQIEIGDYFPMLHRFLPTLRKIVFIGDDKQLAPYGQGDIYDLRSVFEMAHLRNRSVFLDTQYRMPVPIGAFISANVYNNRLKSEHDIKTPSSCRFVNVANGKEEKKGYSWMNTREVQVAVSLAKKFHATGKSYRIITPYDAQRSQLENALKTEKLPWGDRCFNVDSFQGNEEDYIILSLVRSQKIGFMKEKRRVNVMLTRCKKGMIILTNRVFIEGQAARSLVGGLAKAFGPGTWLESGAVLHRDFPPFS